MSHGFVFRPGTQDEAMFHHLVANPEYPLPARFELNDIILDIGAHIGIFSYMALERGAQHVYAFEAERSNYECAQRNLKSYGKRIRLSNQAVWRSDRPITEKLYFTPSLDAANTGGGNVIWGTQGQEVQPVAFDQIIDQVTGQGTRRIRMLKIDCEGSEFTILMTSKRLHLIEEIGGEYHEFCGDYDSNPIPHWASVAGYDRFTIVELTSFLESQGFRVSSSRHPGTNLGLFHAENQARAIPRPAFLKRRLHSVWQGLKRGLKAS